MAKPTFINIGPGRCATSWLFEVFKAHPEITMANVKETEYFNTFFDKGNAWYEGHFPDEGRPCVGEISNCYYVDVDVVDRILTYNPDVRLIVNLRDPYDLMQSFHGFGIRRGLELASLPESLDVPIGRLMGSGFEHRKKKGTLTRGDTATLLESSMLAERLKPFIDSFPPEQVYFFVYERLKEERATVLAEIYEFLGVDSSFVPPVAEKVINASIEPKSKLLARVIPKITFLLRRMGLHSVLSRLHRSELIKSLLYNKTADKPVVKVDPRELLNSETQRILDSEIDWLKQNVPAIGQTWNRRSNHVERTVNANVARVD